MKGAVALLSVSFFLALVNSCSLNNGILRPSCTVFHIHLVECKWQPTGLYAATSSIYFRSLGNIEIQGEKDSITYTLNDCNLLEVTNHTKSSYEEWTIEKLTDIDLEIQYPDGKKVSYLKAQ